MRVTVVGCSGSVPGPQSAASCYLVEVEGVEPDEAEPSGRTANQAQPPGVAANQAQPPGVGANQAQPPGVGADQAQPPGVGADQADQADPAAPDESDADPLPPAGRRRTWRLLLDLGSGALGPLQRYTDPMGVDAVLLTHLHADHCLDVCGLYVMLKHAPGAVSGRSVAVWGPGDTAGRLARAYDLPAPGMAPYVEVSTWTDGRPVRIGPVTVTPYAVYHPVEAYGLRLEHDGRVLAYTGDTDACDALLPLCRDADLVLADSAYVEGRDRPPGVHLSGRRAAESVVRAGGVQRLVLTHLPPWNDPEVSVAEARAVWDGPLEVARPGATYDV